MLSALKPKSGLLCDRGYGVRCASFRGRTCIQSILLSILVFVMLTGCSTLSDAFTIEEVKPWQRGTLARDDMQLTTDAMHQSVDDHIYFSKEASTGGSSVQGGGCGCN